MASPQIVPSGVYQDFHSMRKLYHTSYTDKVSPQCILIFFQVYFKCTTSCESLATMGTNKWFLPSVNYLMHNKIITL